MVDENFEIASLEMSQNDYFSNIWLLILHHGWRKFWNFISWDVLEWLFYWFLTMNSSPSLKKIFRHLIFIRQTPPNSKLRTKICTGKMSFTDFLLTIQGHSLTFPDFSWPMVKNRRFSLTLTDRIYPVRMWEECKC